jgi:hypothetical protein
MVRRNPRTLRLTIDYMRGDIQRMVAAGFDSPKDIVSRALAFSDGHELGVLYPIAERLTREAIATHLAAQERWPAVPNCDLLDRAFEELGRAGVVSRQHCSCCHSCGRNEILGEISAAREDGLEVRGYTLDHIQCIKSAVEGWKLDLYYGAVEKGEEPVLRVAHEIVDALRRQGLRTEWDGTLSNAIRVKLD